MKNTQESGLIYVPYNLVPHTEESRREYNKFMEEYNYNHKFCPICRSKKHISTLVGYILDMDKKEEYKDLNTCQCLNCGDIHTCHDRIKNKYKFMENFLTKKK